MRGGRVGRLLNVRPGEGRVVALAVAVSFVAFVGLMIAGGVSWVPQALWLLQGMAWFLVGWSVWGLGGLVADTRQAKRFFPLIGAGSGLGQVIGRAGPPP